MNSIQFLLDNKLVEIDFQHDGLTPTTTVLNYLRNLPDRKGTKEGCAEGDCGACTVAIASLGREGLVYEACDACLIFLPMIHGKQLLTVESLGTYDNMHPIQQAMVDLDGSQCGYCTPGFVMSMFSLYKSGEDPTMGNVNDALTGNLCRCTGYQSIVKSTMASCANRAGDKFSALEKNTIAQLQDIQNNTDLLELKVESQMYFRPNLLSEACQLRSDFPNAILINGATDIALKVTKQREVLSQILDLSGITELKEIKSKADGVIYGAGTSLEAIRLDSKDKFPALTKMLSVFGSRQIRNLATLGGNIGSSSPIGDMPPVLMAYDAVVNTRSINGSREIPIREFITGYRENMLKQSEIIESVFVPNPPEDVQIASYKISKRKDLDISTVSAGFSVEVSKDSIVEDIQLFYGGMAAMTKKAFKCQKFLLGKAWSRENVEKAMEIIDKDFTPISDARSGAEGRQAMARNLLMKFWSETTMDLQTV